MRLAHRLIPILSAIYGLMSQVANARADRAENRKIAKMIAILQKSR